NIFLIFYDNDGTSHKSNTIIKLLVTKDNRLPFKPYNISLIKFNDGSCNVSWKDSSRFVEKYELWRKIDFAGEYILHQELSGNSFNTNDYNLDTNKIYFYKLRGVKASGISDFSNEVNTEGIITSGNLYPPTNLTATLTGTSVVTLNWKDNSDNENYFSVERSTDNVIFNSIAALSRNRTTYKDSGNGLLIGTTYNYRIKSYSNTDSALSSTITIRITSNFLQPPSKLTANYDSTIGVIKLDWVNNDSNTLFIDIERRTENTNFTVIKKIDSGNTLYLDFNITKNQVYTYRIRGFDLNTFSDYSNEVTISTF
ncbi:MAG: fibronectin type III domain-containing protein, partial [Ignavibacteria bacterium]|nr:fibronectin type III domain-containing protein [Ignavibacteria bacterium]